MSASNVYLFVSAPADPTRNDTANKLKDKLGSAAEVQPFNLPEFKIGTLDTLVVLSDDLGKADTVAETVATKLAESLRSLLNNDMEQWRQNLTVADKPVDAYIKGFQWNSMKYRTDKTLRELCDTINLEVNNIDTLMKGKLQQYTQVKTQLGAMQRKNTGNLSIRNLSDVVKKEDFVLDSEYLTTVCVAVPKALNKLWSDTYETLTEMVVPRSSRLIAEDDEFSLYTVTLFQRVLDEFTTKAREKRFIVRDFKWNESQIQQDKKELAEITGTEKELWSNLLRLSKTNFGEVFSSWIHIKALRLYVESILRYGLPPDFQPMVVKPAPKQEKKVRDLMAAQFAHLAGGSRSSTAGGKKGAKKAKEEDFAMDENIQMLLGGDKDYFPYVSFTATWDLGATGK
ncbi:ATPase, V1 complex, subunit C [Hyaloraphidium curvatum]|nr:ATPase, V1 complex, subunit C [Hyaloraphidium curvatum]